MNTKHTPGPWEAQQTIGNSFEILNIRKVGFTTVANLFPDVSQPGSDKHGFATSEERNETCAANATLIAAAPDLLAALEVALPRLAGRLAPEDLQARRIAKLTPLPPRHHAR